MDEFMAEEESFIANKDDYLKMGMNIATRTKSPGMKKFIYKTRDDGLYLLDISTIDQRIKAAANMIAGYVQKDIIVTASRLYAVTAAEKFAELVGARFIKGRVAPGIFTNPHKEGFTEPKLIVISDTRNERQAVREASMVNIPIIALCDTDNSTKFMDLIVPVNNRGRKALAFTYYLLAREVLKDRGEIKGNEEFKSTEEDFEAKLEDRMAVH